MVNMMPPAPPAARKGQMWPGRRALRGPATAGIDQMVTEPSAVIGMNSGDVKATLGEPTEEYPEGQPEMMTITNSEGETGEDLPGGMPQGDDPQIIAGFRMLLKALGGGTEFASGGGLFTQPGPGSGGKVGNVGGSATPNVFTNTSARKRYIDEQNLANSARMQAAQRIQSLKPSEQQSQEMGADQYKYNLGGLQRPRTGYELAQEQEDTADEQRTLRVNAAGYAAQSESLAESMADKLRAEQDRAESRAERDRDRQEEAANRAADLKYAEEDRRQALADQRAEQAAAGRSRSANDQARRDAQAQALQEYYRQLNQAMGHKYESGGNVLFGADYVNRLADSKAGTKRIDAETRRISLEDKGRDDAEDYKTRKVVKSYEARSKALSGPTSSGRLSRYKEEDLPDLVKAGAISRAEANQELINRGRDATGVRDAFDFPEKLQARATAEANAKKPDPRFKYSKDSMGRLSDDDLLDRYLANEELMATEKGTATTPGKTVDWKGANSQEQLVAAMRARNYDMDDIKQAIFYAKQAKAKSKAGNTADLIAAALGQPPK